MGTTQQLADFAASTSFKDLPDRVVHEAKRDIINLIGVALYASVDPSLKILLDMFEAEGGNPRAGIWGTGRRTTLANAALANGWTGHLEDYDDTHFPTVIHPSAPTVPAAWALAEANGSSGQDVLAAVALGIEICCRLGVSLHPWHYDEGWHITGTMGVFGSAVAAGRLHGLNAAQITVAMGIAGTQAAGLRENFGTMAKPLHAGRAAEAGVVAALLAKGGFTASTTIIEGRRGVAEVMSPGRELSRATDKLGQHWEMFQNGLKPYSCGVVSHPAIDAAIAIHNRPGFNPANVTDIEALVHPLVPELMGRPNPTTGLECKFSSQHCMAVGLVDGAAYPDQYSDAKAADPLISSLRAKVRLVVTPGTLEEAMTLRVSLKDGSVIEQHVPHATGSPKNPLSDDHVNEKFLTMARRAMSEADAKAVLDGLWRLDEAKTVVGLVP
ncbi:MAG: MmgE/PrpD family protein [Dehalococcoidia bacterium]|nr:MmgE/PrpD family protein [Dehalococcoidia bacterium]